MAASGHNLSSIDCPVIDRGHEPPGDTAHLAFAPQLTDCDLVRAVALIGGNVHQQVAGRGGSSGQFDPAERM